MIAIIQTGGKQLRVEKDAIIYIEKLNIAEGQIVTFDKVLYADAKVGNPFIKGTVVTGVVEKHGKQPKINVIRYRAKSNLRKRYGHRQPYTRIKITDIICK